MEENGRCFPVSMVQKKYPVAKVCKLKTYHEVIVHVDVYDGEKDLSDLFT